MVDISELDIPQLRQIHKGEFLGDSHSEKHTNASVLQPKVKPKDCSKTNGKKFEIRVSDICDSRFSVDSGYGGSVCEASLLTLHPEACLTNLSTKSTNNHSQSSKERNVDLNGDSISTFLQSGILSDRCQSLKTSNQKFILKNKFSTFTGNLDSNGFDGESDEIFENFSITLPLNDDQQKSKTLRKDFESQRVKIDDEIKTATVEPVEENDNHNDTISFPPDPTVFKRKPWIGWRRREKKSFIPELSEVFQEEEESTNDVTKEAEQTVDILEKFDKNFYLSVNTDQYQNQDEIMEYLKPAHEYPSASCSPVFKTKRKKKKKKKNKSFETFQENRTANDENECQDVEDDEDVERKLTRQEEDMMMYDPYLDETSYAYKSTKHLQELEEQESSDVNTNDSNNDEELSTTSDDSDIDYTNDTVEEDTYSYKYTPIVSHDNFKEMCRQIFQSRRKKVPCGSSDGGRTEKGILSRMKGIFQRKKKNVSSDLSNPLLNEPIVNRNETMDAGEEPGTSGVKRKRQGMRVLTNLQENMRNQRSKRPDYGDDNDRDGNQDPERPSTSRKLFKDEAPEIYNCDYCFKFEESQKKFKESEIRELSEAEKLMIECKLKATLNILCFNHYRKFVSAFKSHQQKCTNLFGDHSSPRKTKLKDVTFDLARQAREFTVLDLIPFQKICNACESKLISLIEVEKKRKEMSYINESSTEDTEEEVYGTPPEEEISRIDNQHKVDQVFDTLNLSPIKSNKVTDAKYLAEKLQQLPKACSEKLGVELDSEEEDKSEEICRNIKKDLKEMTKREKVAVIGVLPKSWSVNQIQEKTGASRRLISEVKKGTVSHERKANKNRIPEKHKQAVRDFFMDSRISYHCPGTNDKISIKMDDGKKVQVQKLLLNMKIHVAYNMFRAENPNIDICFSSFHSLKPRQCVVVGKNKSSHRQCLCIYHNNCELLIDSSILGELTCFRKLIDENEGVELSWESITKILVCDGSKVPKDSDCWLGDCDSCKNKKDILKEKLVEIFESQEIETVSYTQWKKTQGSNKITWSVSIEEFAKTFSDDMDDLKTHDYVKEEQEEYIRNLKKELPLNCIIIQMDYSG